EPVKQTHEELSSNAEQMRSLLPPSDSPVFHRAVYLCQPIRRRGGGIPGPWTKPAAEFRVPRVPRTVGCGFSTDLGNFIPPLASAASAARGSPQETTGSEGERRD